jgi:hypothetical protein
MGQGNNTILTGSSGSVAGLSNRLYSITANYSRSALDSTGLGALDATTDYGLGRLSGTAQGYQLVAASGSGNNPAYFTEGSIKATMTVTWDTGKTDTFTAVISGVRIVGEIDRANIITFDFVRDGASNFAY